MTPHDCAMHCFMHYTSEYFGITKGTTCACANAFRVTESLLKTSVEADESAQVKSCVSNGQGLETDKGKPCIFPSIFNEIEFNFCVGQGWGGQGICFIDREQTLWAGCDCTTERICNARCSGNIDAPCGGADDLYSSYRIVMPPSMFGSTMLYTAFEDGSIEAYEVVPETGGKFSLFNPKLKIPPYNLNLGRNLKLSASHNAMLTEATLLVSDADTMQVVFMDTRQIVLGSFAVVSGGTTRHMHAVASPGTGRIYVSISGQNAVYAYEITGKNIWDVDTSSCVSLGALKCGQPGECTGAQDRFCQPRALFVDHDSNLYVADNGNSRVQSFSPDGTFLRTFGGGGELQGAISVAVSSSKNSLGYVYVLDEKGVIIFRPNGQFFKTHSSLEALPRSKSISLMQPHDDPEYCVLAHGEAARGVLRAGPDGVCKPMASFSL